MHITINDISFEVSPGASIHDAANYWTSVNEHAWEPETFAIMQQYLSKSSTYLDIGAWVGPTVLYGAQLCRQCYAFEPDPVAFSGLMNNIVLNPAITNVQAQQAAVSGTTGTVAMGAKITPGDSMSSMLWSEQSWTVPGISLEDIITQNNIAHCDFIKMDIEGGEAMALAGKRAFFETYQPVLYLSLHTPWIPGPDAFFEMLADTLGGYTHIRNGRGEPVTMQQVCSNYDFTTLVFSHA